MGSNPISLAASCMVKGDHSRDAPWGALKSCHGGSKIGKKCIISNFLLKFRKMAILEGDNSERESYKGVYTD